MRACTAAGILLLGIITVTLGETPGVPRKADVPKYLGMLKNSSNAKDRALGAEMLGKRGAIRGSDVADAIEPLKMALKNDKDMTVRQTAAEALGNIGADPETIVPVL